MKWLKVGYYSVGRDFNFLWLDLVAWFVLLLTVLKYQETNCPTQRKIKLLYRFLFSLRHIVALHIMC